MQKITIVTLAVSSVWVLTTALIVAHSIRVKKKREMKLSEIKAHIALVLDEHGCGRSDQIFFESERLARIYRISMKELGFDSLDEFRLAAAHSLGRYKERLARHRHNDVLRYRRLVRINESGRDDQDELVATKSSLSRSAPLLRSLRQRIRSLVPGAA